MTTGHDELPLALTRLFPLAIRDRGEQYVARQLVRVVNSMSNAVQAVVRGSMDYEVEVDAVAGAITVSCSCPYAADGHSCKHMWAVLRDAQRNGTFAPLLTTAGVQFIGSVGPHVHVVVPVDVPSPDQAWKRAFESAERQMQIAPPYSPDDQHATWPVDHRVVYIANLDASVHATGLVMDIGSEQRASDGSWGPPKRLSIGSAAWLAAPDLQDKHIAEMLIGAEPVSPFDHARTSGFVIGVRAFPTTLHAICATGRCRLRSASPTDSDGSPLGIDEGAAWRFRLRVLRDSQGAHTLIGVLVRDDEEMALAEPSLVHSAGFLIARGVIAQFDHVGAFPLATELRHTPSMPLDGELSELLERLHALPRMPELDLPEGSLIGAAHAEPVPSVTFGIDVASWRQRNVMSLALEFCYGATRIRAQSSAPTLFDRQARMLHHRHREAEDRARSRLLSLGAKGSWNVMRREYDLFIARDKLSVLITTLAQEGWETRAGGVTYRAPSEIRASVQSGIDWFDLAGFVRFGDIDVSMASLLQARKLGRDVIELAPGVVGLLPIEWLDRLGPLVGTAEAIDGMARFKRSQLSLLDALLATMPDVDLDDTFKRARAELAGFETVEPATPPDTFRGTLREYQREGLGWLHFLRRFELGGCLADDMGLGKTVQVLALLDARRAEGHGPSLVVVPRSLVFNWIREAERFAPQLVMLDLSVGARRIDQIAGSPADVIVTTYGALRRDAAALAKVDFDYAILDEAQAIKNAGTATAKACRLIRARHRLALTGTPIENRIEELWSLLEFLNPGMLGTSSKFSALARFGSPTEGEADTGGRALLSRALRPVMLRRTKAMVATELPARMEQTLEVILEPKQRAFYEHLREQYRASLLERVGRDGVQKSRMHILEALLRLRQAACHPALADPTKKGLPSAKLDALIPTLIEVASEGHKSIVFSQFTSFLALVRERLDAEGIAYEYLDGRTRDREARVNRFQTDITCPIFLISLKAGGHGLNLTAADYVYLLDPWWNPAVEAQAIDRAHRIGQTRRVIATRFVARDTIEQKILQLQGSKRALADAILTSDKGALSSIGRAELELLLEE